MNLYIIDVYYEGYKTPNREYVKALNRRIAMNIIFEQVEAPSMFSGSNISTIDIVKKVKERDILKQT